MKIKNTILAISPHPDDIELAAGGTIAKALDEGNDVNYVTFSDCSDTFIRTPFSPDTLQEECKKAMRAFGVKSKNVYFHNLPNKEYILHKRDIFLILESLRDILKPNTILIPDPRETHQDHATVAEQAISVFRRGTSILAYEQPWNDLEFTPDYFVDLKEIHIKKKLDALKNYKTQQYFKRPYFSEEFIRGLATIRGVQSNTRYAEAYHVIKLIA